MLPVAKSRYGSQKENILQWLMNKPITPMEALEHIGSMRLAAHIEVLRKEGYNIVTEDVKHNGKHFARYHLNKEKL
jgi:Helix-turn-helix domain